MTTPEQILTVAENAARVGGQVLLDWVGKFSVREKSRANLVTEADEASQSAILEAVRRHYPDHAFLGEEGLVLESDSDWRWVIDPLDGTSNYVHGFPYWAVSIGVECQGELTAGVIYDPNRDEMFSAIRGGGASLNGEPIRTSGESDPEQTMAMASLPVSTDIGDPAVRRFLNALPQLQTVQRSGSAALNLCCVACGRVDAFWSTSLNPWDVAAGMLLVKEAGGAVTNVRGEPTDIHARNLLATAGDPLTQALVPVLSLDG